MAKQLKHLLPPTDSPIFTNHEPPGMSHQAPERPIKYTNEHRPVESAPTERFPLAGQHLSKTPVFPKEHSRRSMVSVKNQKNHDSQREREC